MSFSLQVEQDQEAREGREYQEVKARYIEYELLPTDWCRLREVGPYSDQWQLLRDDGHTKIFVVEALDSNTIIAVWMAKDVVLLEGLYIDPVCRHRAPVARRLLTLVKRFLRGAHVRLPLTITVEPHIAYLAKKAGFQPISNGVLHVWNLDQIDQKEDT